MNESRSNEARWRFQFSLRTLFVFIFAFALGFVARNVVTGLQPFAMGLALPSANSPVEPGDVLLVESAGNPDLNRRVTVLADGTVSLPLLGSVAIGGQDTAGVEKTLTGGYAQYFARPQIQVYRADVSEPMSLNQ